MSELHELLAAESDLESAFNMIVKETMNSFAKKENLFFGSIRTLKVLEDGIPEEVPERQEIVETVPGKLEYTQKSVTRYFDAVLQKDNANQSAKADLLVDEVAIAEGLPATFLLGLEKKLKKVRDVYSKTLTLQPGVSWVPDEDKGKNIFKTEHPEVRDKTKQRINHKVLVPATDKHPAQIEKWPENEVIGRYEKITWSGAISPARKSELLERIDNLIRSVKKARSRANKQKVVKKSIGATLFKYIHDGKI